MSRRAWLLSNAARTVPAVAAATAFSLTPNSARAIVDDATTKSTAPTTASSSSSSSTKWTVFEDPKHGFSLQIPSDWTFTQQTLRDRRTLYLWTDPNPSSSTTPSALFIAYTPIRDDFTSLNSFGTVDQVAAQTILPKTELLLGSDNAIRATMVEAKAQQSAYYFDYKQSVPAMSTTTTTVLPPEMHYRTIFTLSSQAASGGAGSVLVTITAQTSEEQYQNAAVRNVFDTIIDSFRKI